MKRNYGYYGTWSWRGIIAYFVVLIAVVYLFMACHNTCTDTEWNNGICAQCETRYELRCVYKSAKYYSCPTCGNQIMRY